MTPSYTGYPMRILLIGNTGQLGWELQRTLAPLGEILACDYPDIDLANTENIRQVFYQCKPNLVVNAAAYTAVDRAETEPDLANAINAQAPAILAQEAKKSNAALIHYSTDYVFDGLKGSPYLESDPPNPLGVYGRSKLAGEREVQQIGGSYLIFRTSWVYSLRRDSFVKKFWVGRIPNRASNWSRTRLVDPLGHACWLKSLARSFS